MEAWSCNKKRETARPPTFPGGIQGHGRDMGPV
ncbi:MAG: hypothetical protein JWM68_5234, partial [Verrucomicrobiales bacterium]|nr:hypothetical protein [Verrucomicrobiales bacterium]